MNELREEVRDRYAAAARSVKDGLAANDWDEVAGCCDPKDGLGVQLYDVTQRQGLPEEAVLASLGCGNPTAVAELREGETVLDLGSGGGIDVLLSARRVGPTGKVYGLDMTDEMLELARGTPPRPAWPTSSSSRATSRTSRCPDASVDVIISNCVINLSTDKPKVVRRDVPRAAAGRAYRHQRHRRHGRAHARGARRARELRRVHRRCAVVRRVPRRARRARGSPTSGSTPTHEVTDEMFGAIVRAAQGLRMSAERVPEVLFVCVHNAGRSQMAAALLERHAAGRVAVRSAGSTPADEINPAVVEAMAEVGIDLSAAVAEAPDDRGRPGLRRRRDDGVRRRVPGVPRQALPGLGARRPCRASRRRRGPPDPRRDRRTGEGAGQRAARSCLLRPVVATGG